MLLTQQGKCCFQKVVVDFEAVGEKAAKVVFLRVKGHSHLKGVGKIILSEAQTPGRTQCVRGDDGRNKDQNKYERTGKSQKRAFPPQLMHCTRQGHSRKGSSLF